MKNTGEFLEIIPNQKIVFTWCQDFDSNPTPDTKVQIELKDLGGKTALMLTHSGFTDAENKDAHEGGWSGGLEDLSQEITNGRLRLMRKFSEPVPELFLACKKQFENSDNKITEVILNKKIAFTCPKGTKATLLFDAEDDLSASWIEILHEGLTSEEAQKSTRNLWDAWRLRGGELNSKN